jgi:hypothetical protein
MFWLAVQHLPVFPIAEQNHAAGSARAAASPAAVRWAEPELTHAD